MTSSPGDMMMYPGLQPRMEAGSHQPSACRPTGKGVDEGTGRRVEQAFRGEPGDGNLRGRTEAGEPKRVRLLPRRQGQKGFGLEVPGSHSIKGVPREKPTEPGAVPLKAGRLFFFRKINFRFYLIFAITILNFGAFLKNQSNLLIYNSIRL